MCQDGATQHTFSMRGSSKFRLRQIHTYCRYAAIRIDLQEFGFLLFTVCQADGFDFMWIVKLLQQNTDFPT